MESYQISRRIYIASVRAVRNSDEQSPLTRFPGRTGRFGRKGISINFVHDENTWAQMEAIENATGKSIIRIETTDLDIMEEVRMP